MARYAPLFTRRVTFALLALLTIGAFALGLAFPYIVGDSPGGSSGPTTTRARPVPVAQTTVPPA